MGPVMVPEISNINNAFGNTLEIGVVLIASSAGPQYSSGRVVMSFGLHQWQCYGGVMTDQKNECIKAYVRAAIETIDMPEQALLYVKGHQRPPCPRAEVGQKSLAFRSWPKLA